LILESSFPPVAIPNVDVGRYVLDAAAERGSAPAIVDALTGRTITYAGLDDQARRLAAGLMSAGLRPGDVVTHSLTGRRHGILDYQGKVLPAVREARQAGIHFDAAHGRSHFGFEAIRRILDDGFLVDTLSTDISEPTSEDPTFHLPQIMSKLMALGVSLDDVVPLVTSNSARYLKREDELGTLRPGACGDVSILELQEGDFTLRDNEGQTIQTRQRLRPWRTVRAGQVVEAPAES
jgi:dihydroorotase